MVLCKAQPAFTIMSTNSLRPPYRGLPRKYTHPDVLAAHARLFGFQAPRTESARVLELGCGDGSNLLSIACSLPGATCIGVDMSASQIEQGNRLREAAGLPNVSLMQEDFTQETPAKGTFDYIIAHGVYSWISPEAQGRLLARIQKQLAPRGVAFVSYNCYPGWNLRKLTRDLLGYTARGIADPQEQVNLARQVLPQVLQSIPSTLPGYAALLQEEHQLLSQAGDSYLAHEHLEADNWPCYFHEFAARAQAQELQYLCEAELSSMHINRFPAPLAALQTAGGGVIEAEQLLDFATLRMFRQTLLCHRDVPLNRQLSSKTVQEMRASSLGIYTKAPTTFTAEAETFQGAKGGSVVLSDPLSKAAFLVLAEHWPASLEFPRLEALARERLAAAGQSAETASSGILAQSLLAGATVEVLELHTAPSRATGIVSERPYASELARAQAQAGPLVSSLRHLNVNLDAFSWRLLPKLDGTRKVDDLVKEAGADISALQVEGALRNLARLGLLVEC